MAGASQRSGAWESTIISSISEGIRFLAAILFKRLEERWGRRLPVSVLIQSPTIAQLAALLDAEQVEDRETRTPSSSLVPIQPKGSSAPFFCIHGAGGNVLLYRDLARHLGPEQPLYGLQARGLDGTSPFCTTIEEMAARYLDEMRAVQGHGPYHLGGYCMGGTIAFQIAQELQARGERVALLALFDTRAVWRRLGIHCRMFHFLQRLLFHVGNLTLAGSQGQAAFLRGKDGRREEKDSQIHQGGDREVTAGSTRSARAL